MSGFSESGNIIHNLLDLIEQFVHPALRNKALSDSRYVTAKKYLGEYKKSLIWENSDNVLGEYFAITDIGVYYIVKELNNLISLQFEDYVLGITELSNIDQLKDQAESDYIFRQKIQKVS